MKKKIIQEKFKDFGNNNYDWEKNCALIFAKKKKLFDTNMEYEKKLSKMARAGFPYEICKEILKID